MKKLNKQTYLKASNWVLVSIQLKSTGKLIEEWIRGEVREKLYNMGR